MRKLTLKAGGRELLLRYDLQAMWDIEEEHGSMDALLEKMDGRDKPAAATAFLVACMVNAGERYRTGKDEIDAVTPEWLRKNLSPGQLCKARRMALEAMVLGNHREFVADDDGDVDETLAEIRQKKEKALQEASQRAST